MLVSLRLQARVLYEKERSLSIKLDASEQKSKEREEQLLGKDQEINKMREKIAILKRQIGLEKVRLKFSLQESKRAAEKEKIELKEEMEKAAIGFENEKRALKKVVLEGRQEIALVRNRLEKSIRETALVTANFKTFYDEYLDLQKQLTASEQNLVPLKMLICELAKAMNLEPEELQLRLDRLKIALTSNENVGSVKELFMKTLLDEDKDEVTPNDSQVASAPAGSSASASFNDPQPPSSSSFEQSDPSCPFSQKVLPEQLDNPSHKEAKSRKHKTEKGRMVRLKKLGFKTPSWPLRQHNSR